MTHRIAVVACIRWEHAHIGEWVAYHRSIGVDHIYIYCNDDDPADMRAALRPYTTGRRPFVSLTHYRLPGQQIQAYLHFIDTAAHETEWFILLDGDEFIYAADFDLPRTLDRMAPIADAIYLHWLLFGYNGRQQRAADGVLADHDRRAATLNPHTKVLIRSSVAIALNPRLRLEIRHGPIFHFWDLFSPPELRLVDALGRDLRNYSDFWQAPQYFAWLTEPEAQARILQTAFIAHFMIKSEQDFERRARRGSLGDYRSMDDYRAFGTDPHRRHEILAMDAIPDRRFADYWQRARPAQTSPPRRIATGRCASLPPQRVAERNCAQDGAATQSSTLYPHLGAAKSIDGICANRIGSHTDHETSPWWQLAFATPRPVCRIVIYGCRSQVIADGTRYRIDLLDTRGATSGIYLSAAPEELGGLESAPCEIVLAEHPMATGLRITRLDPGYLYFEEVEVYTPVLHQKGQGSALDPLGAAPPDPRA